MNALAPVSYAWPEASQPHRFTLDDVLALREAGVVHPDAKIELLDGEIIDMPAEGELHAEFVSALVTALIRRLGGEHLVVPGSRLSLGPEDAPVPDLYVMDARATMVLTPPAALRLVVEIADSSLAQDMGRKAAKYGAYGVTEYWIIDVRHGVTHVHTQPRSGGYTERRAVAFDHPLRPALLPGLEIVLADLPRLAGLSFD